MLSVALDMRHLRSTTPVMDGDGRELGMEKQGVPELVPLDSALLPRRGRAGAWCVSPT